MKHNARPSGRATLELREPKIKKKAKGAIAADWLRWDLIAV